MSVLPGFTIGQPDNLPKIDSESMYNFFKGNTDFIAAEIKGVKTKKSERESYGDNAIGYVQVKRDSNLCIVKAQVTPEQSVNKKGYAVTVTCNETEEEVLSVICETCPASQGGCKHGVALLAWIHRRSEEPAVTSVANYWKPSHLSRISKSKKFIKAKDLFKTDLEPLPPKTGAFLNTVFAKCKSEGQYDAVLPKYFKRTSDVEGLSLHHLLYSFLEKQPDNSTADEFIDYCKTQMSQAVCDTAEKKTVLQSESALWHELRYARITASKAYEAAHCQTLDGSLVETILGATRLRDSAAMLRGKRLESGVRNAVEKAAGIKVELCGLRTSVEHPIMGATPDGLSTDFVIEIKCPSTEKTMKNYVKNGEIGEKYKAQMQMQMFFYQKKKALFCVASTDFENSHKVSIMEEYFNEQYCMDIIKKCTDFWKLAVYPVIKKSVK